MNFVAFDNITCNLFLEKSILNAALQIYCVGFMFVLIMAFNIHIYTNRFETIGGRDCVICFMYIYTNQCTMSLMW